MTPFFSLITPTLQRESLIRCCESVNNQSFTQWEQIVFIDAVKMDSDLMDKIRHPQRTVMCMGKRYADFGNTPRNLAWKFATGEWLWHCDDDNFAADDNVLKDVAEILEPLSPEIGWTAFPIMRHGQRFIGDPPRSCHADTMNILARREIGQWPSGPEYTMDGIWIDALREKYPYQAFPNFRPIGIMEHSGRGE